MKHSTCPSSAHTAEWLAGTDLCSMSEDIQYQTLKRLRGQHSWRRWQWQPQKEWSPEKAQRTDHSHSPSHTEDTRKSYGCSACEVTISGTNGTTATKSRKIEGASIKTIPLSKLDSVRKFIHIIHICAKLRRFCHQQRWYLTNHVSRMALTRSDVSSVTRDVSSGARLPGVNPRVSSS